MKKAMIIVESRAKTQSIGKFVGEDYIVQHCFGHVYDLPENDLGVDVNNNFKPKYVPVKNKEKLIKTLQKDAEKVKEIILATDPDREGESIAWHLARMFEGKKIKRMTFNEITKKAVTDALGNLTDIDERLVNAQQARRVLDRLVGYKLSPLLWRRVKEGLSAGRVQSVALRLIVDREREIEKFVPEEYWKLTATFSRAEKKSDVFKSLLLRLDGKELKSGNEEKEIKIGGDEEAENLKKELLSHAYHVQKITKKVVKTNPYAPYITSTLQQDASGRINFSPSRTMTIAQQLYEGIELGPEGTTGLITYMRTDSVRVSDEAIAEARSYILEKFGADYVPQKATRYKTKSAAQDAHEAIRPTNISREPSDVAKFLTPEQQKLYTLVWNRFVASQMNPEKREAVSVDIANGRALFRTTGSIQLFDGFRRVYKQMSEKESDSNDEKDDKSEQLPKLSEKEKLNLEELLPSQHFTKPPARFSEASIVRTLEEKGIGRPSTYVPTIDTIKKRGYVQMEKRIFHPTQWGFIVTELLAEHFKDIMDYDFTARMEDNLDSIEAGKQDWVKVVGNFYETFSKELELAFKTMRYEKKVDALCEKCGGGMVLRSGKFGLFYACSKYPECKNTKPFSGMGTTEDLKEIKKSEPQPTDKKCEKCGSPMLLREGRYGKFLACSTYPKCRYSRPFIGDFPCPKKDCTGQLTRRFTKRRRAFYGCTRYPDCDFVSWYAPNEVKCPKCDKFTFKKKSKEGYELACSSEECGHTFAEEAAAETGKE